MHQWTTDFWYNKIYLLFGCIICAIKWILHTNNFEYIVYHVYIKHLITSEIEIIVYHDIYGKLYN